MLLMLCFFFAKIGYPFRAILVTYCSNSISHFMTNFFDNTQNELQTIFDGIVKVGNSTFELKASAIKALQEGDIEKLDELRARGFNPWMEPDESNYKLEQKYGYKETAGSTLAYWAIHSLNDPSGESLLWLAKSFEPFLTEWRRHSEEQLWNFVSKSTQDIKLKPVCLLLNFSFKNKGPEDWIRLFEAFYPFDFFEPFLKQWSDHVGDEIWKKKLVHKNSWGNSVERSFWDLLADMEVYADVRSRRPLSQKQHGQIMDLLMTHVPDQIDTTTLKASLVNVALSGYDLTSFKSLIERFFKEDTTPHVLNAEFNNGKAEEWKERVVERLMRLSYINNHSKLDFGSVIVGGGNFESVQMAWESDWIKPIEVVGYLNIENPHFASYDKAKIEKEQGREINMQGRFDKIRKNIEKSSYSDAEKERLLTALETPFDLSRPAPTEKRLNAPTNFKLGPQIFILMKCTGNSLKKNENHQNFEAVSNFLSEKGWLLKDALEQLNQMGLKIKKDAFPWLNRGLEREALRAVTQREFAVAKKIKRSI